MKTFPIIPLWIMIVLCLIGLIYLIKNFNKNYIDILLILLLFLINLRIMYPNNKTTTIANNLDILFVIDSTISMNAEDYKNSKTRLYGIKKDCKYIINQLDGARFSIITFDNDSRIIIPYTRDTRMALEAIDIINPVENSSARGSSLNTPFKNILLSLKSASKKTGRKRIIFFISDGEITDNSSLNSYSKIRKYLNNGAVLGYGTTKGGYMKKTKKFSDTNDYIMDDSNSNYKKAISKLNEKNLKKIAHDMNIDYINMSEQKNINYKLNKIKKSAKNSLEPTNKASYNDTYFIFVIPFLIFLLIKFKKLKGEML